LQGGPEVFSPQSAVGIEDLTVGHQVLEGSCEVDGLLAELAPNYRGHQVL